MMKKYGLYGSCVLMLLLAAHGNALSMLHTKKMMSRASRLQLNRRTLHDRLHDDVKDAAHLRDVKVSDTFLMSSQDKELIRRAHIDSIYKVAQIEAMSNIAANPNLTDWQKRYLRDQVPHVVRE